MSLEQRYKDYFKTKSQTELYELITKFKMFIDVSLQESIAGTHEERIKSMYNTLLKLRDTMVFELSMHNHSKNLIQMEEDLKRFEEINEAALEKDSKKNLSLEQIQGSDQ